MFGKLRTSHLLIALALLAVLWWVSGTVSPGAKQRTFPDHLLRLDTAKVDGFTFTPAPYKSLPPLRFRRTSEGWRMYWAADSALADTAPVHDLLRSWSHMRVVNYAGRLADVAARYDLTDSTADELRIGSGEDVHVFLVGRQTAGEPPLTLVHRAEEEDVFAIEGSLGIYADLTFGDWLPKYLVKGDPGAWRRLSFEFPGDSGYVMEKRDGKWFIGSTELDQPRTEKYLRSLSRSRAQTVTNPADTMNAVPRFRLVVEDTTRAAPIEVVVAAREDGFIVRSTLNPGTVMPFDARQEIPRMFRPRQAFLPH